jgi:hypothetical protein
VRVFSETTAPSRGVPVTRTLNSRSGTVGGFCQFATILPLDGSVSQAAPYAHRLECLLCLTIAGLFPLATASPGFFSSPTILMTRLPLPINLLCCSVIGNCQLRTADFTSHSWRSAKLQALSAVCLFTTFRSRSSLRFMCSKKCRHAAPDWP